MSEKKPRLRFRKEAPLPYSDRIGYELMYGDTRVGSASSLARTMFPAGGFYWSSPANETLGITLANTASRPLTTMEEAKAQLRAHVEACLKARGLR